MGSYFVEEPLELLFSNEIFSGISERINAPYILVSNLNDAFRIAFDQNPPAGFKIWKDVVENHRKEMRNDSKFSEADEFVSKLLEEHHDKHKKNTLTYRKMKIKKTNTAYDDFIFSDAREDAIFALGTVSISRYLGEKSELMDWIFEIYKKGGWVCGMKNKKLAVFNPDVLK